MSTIGGQGDATLPLSDSDLLVVEQGGSTKKITRDNFRQGMIAAGTLASRPAAGTADRTYIVTDNGGPYLSRDNGTAWEKVDGSTDEVSHGTLASRPAAGTDGELYIVTDNGGPYLTRDNGTTWEEVQRDISARVYHNANQSIANATTTSLAFNSETYDTDSVHDISTNNERLTASTAGKYLIWGSIAFAANATGIRHAAISLNGLTDLARERVNAASAGETYITIMTEYELSAGDYVTLDVRQESGAALDVMRGADHSPIFGMRRVSP